MKAKARTETRAVADLLGLNANEVHVLRRGLEHGLGSADEEMRIALRNQLEHLEDLLSEQEQLIIQPGQPVCGSKEPHVAHHRNGGRLVNADNLPWCTGVNREGSGPDWDYSGSGHLPYCVTAGGHSHPSECVVSLPGTTSRSRATGCFS